MVAAEDPMGRARRWNLFSDSEIPTSKSSFGRVVGVDVEGGVDQLRVVPGSLRAGFLSHLQYRRARESQHAHRPRPSNERAGGLSAPQVRLRKADSSPARDLVLPLQQPGPFLRAAKHDGLGGRDALRRRALTCQPTRRHLCSSRPWQRRSRRQRRERRHRRHHAKRGERRPALQPPVTRVAKAAHRK